MHMYVQRFLGGVGLENFKIFGKIAKLRKLCEGRDVTDIVIRMYADQEFQEG